MLVAASSSPADRCTTAVADISAARPSAFRLPHSAPVRRHRRHRRGGRRRAAVVGAAVVGPFDLRTRKVELILGDAVISNHICNILRRN